MTGHQQVLSMPHLGGIEVGYKVLPETPHPSKPTLVLFNPFTTTSDYYQPEFENRDIREAVNLLAIEPLGHRRTQARIAENWTYRDSAIMSLQLLDALNIDKAFVSGTSQGGWIAMRMALLAPETARGPRMAFGRAPSRELGCWDGPTATSGLVTLGADLAPADDFEPGNDYRDFLMDIGYGKMVEDNVKAFWGESLKANHAGDEGKRRICMAAVTLASRDSLHARLPYGTGDVVFSFANAEQEIKLLGGVHFLSYTHPEIIHRELLEFIAKWKKDGVRAGL
ncbi:hypothetical protein EKO27_g913 [Xylaria grammica]|uniref:AB hydrolase-1 domain-containing protein n=1 Tax=Xylaria grammica TaxID=363999 RepID=A0A439DII6_9PEZI|nr:hypothetical protein EKO27_g913 [Xylaria grammica]